MIPIPSKAYLYGGLALALAIGAWWIYAKGRDSGRQAQQQENITETKRQIEEIRKVAEAEFQSVSTAAKQEIQAAQERVRSSEARESRLLSTLQSLSIARSDALQKVGQVSDTGLHDAIVGQLAVRSSTDTIPQRACFTFQEERKILEAVTDYPQCQKQADIQTAQIAEVREQVASLRAEVAATAKAAEAERQLRTKYAEFYSTLWNATRQKKRGLKCLGLWKCSLPKPLAVPAPETLAQTPATL